MKLNFKNYKIEKSKKHLTKNNFLLFSIGTNQNSQNWIIIEQGLYKLKLNYHKTYNNITTKIVKNSIFKNSISIINSTFFFFKPKINNKNTIIKINIINALKSIFFTVLSLKLNNKIYGIPKLKNISSLSYKDNVAIIYQFLLTNLKFSYKLNPKKYFETM